MHIMEGFFTCRMVCCLVYYINTNSTLWCISDKEDYRNYSESKALIAVSGAFMFILSSLKLPSVTGSCSHPTGNGFGAVLFGPAVTAVLASIVLIFQALLLAHGGITTLGANIFSMGIVGPFGSMDCINL